MNKKDLPAMYSTAFWCLLFVVLLFFLALLRNHCYSFHRTEVKAGHFDLAGSWTSRTKNPVFSPKFKSAANFSPPAQEGNLFLLSGRSARKKFSQSNRAICAGLRGKSGFRQVPVTTAALTN